MTMDRRNFLRAAGAVGAFAPMSSLSRLAFGEGAGGRGGRDDILVVFFLRGGCDSLNLVAPANEQSYVDDRIAPLRVLDSGDKPGIPLARGLDPKLDFRLHPDAAALGELYAQGRLAIVHAVGLMNETRSHFVAQELIEQGLVSDGSTEDPAHKSGAAVGTGWLDRYARLAGLDRAPLDRIPAMSASNGVDKAFDGMAGTLALPDLVNGAGLAGGDQGRAVLNALYGHSSGVVADSGRLALAKFGALEARLPKGPDGKVLPYQPDGGASYDTGGDSGGRGLEAVARLIKMDVGLRVACVDMGGWDMHDNQPSRFAPLASQFSRNLASFWNDLSRYHDRLTIVTVSEFGRRLRSNKSNGTDHGHGGAMFVLGGKINGGRMYGTWPGLASPELDRAVDLAVTTDYRAVFSAVAGSQIGAGQIGALFPGYTPNRDLGIIRTA
jgi:uncharacterized protein (DUF1501 family)